MFSTSSPTYPASVNVVASAIAKGTFNILARVWASSVLPQPTMSMLMEKCVRGTASADEKKEFGKVWQKRVEDISNNIEKVIKVVKTN